MSTLGIACQAGVTSGGSEQYETSAEVKRVKKVAINSARLQAVALTKMPRDAPLGALLGGQLGRRPGGRLFELAEEAAFGSLGFPGAGGRDLRVFSFLDYSCC